ncbi:hypothetical protein N9L77_09810 [Pseudomonadales bacterium]|nr:hypothetical protein [Pseudomonadales bacterium]
MRVPNSLCRGFQRAKSQWRGADVAFSRQQGHELGRQIQGISARSFNAASHRVVGDQNRTPDQDGEDSFALMAARDLQTIDRVVVEQMGGQLDRRNDEWIIPLAP